MRRLFPSLIALIAVAVASAALFRLWRDTRTTHPEIPLGDGSVLIVEGLTWGTNQVLWLESPYWTRLKQALPAKWRQFTGEPQPPWVVNGDPSPHLWLSRRSVATGQLVSVGWPSLFTLLSDATGSSNVHEIPSLAGRGNGGNKRADLAASFEALDWRADALRFRVSTDMVTQDFALPNPRRHERFPVWQPAPLPQTHVVNGFELELFGLATWPETHHWRAQWSITRGKSPATEWFDTEAVLLDPPGNRAWFALPSSEPVCKVVLTAWPSAQFPFAEAQLFRLDRLKVPGPGDFILVPVNGEATNACLHWAVLTGSGDFAFRNGTNRIARPPGDSTLSHYSSLGSSDWDCSFGSSRPQLHLLLRGPEGGGRLLTATTNHLDRLVLRARTASGAVVKTTAQGHLSSGDGTTLTQWRAFEFDALPAGEFVELDLTLVAPIRTEFTVATPSAK